METKNKVDFVGSVSSGTMLTDDLLSAFLGVLEHYWPEAEAEVRGELFIAGNDEDRRSEILNDKVWCYMNDLAPDGYYFGSHPGDGADYGYWKNEDDDNDGSSGLPEPPMLPPAPVVDPCDGCPIKDTCSVNQPERVGNQPLGPTFTAAEAIDTAEALLQIWYDLTWPGKAA